MHRSRNDIILHSQTILFSQNSQMEHINITNNISDTKKLGKKLAKEILSFSDRKNAFVIALKGDLGSGKTTFLQGFAKGLGIQEKILSPTFVIFKKFPSFDPAGAKGGKPARNASQAKRSDAGGRNFYHIDCYRIQNSKEILDLGFEQMISEPKNIIAIEWAERIEDILPKDTLILNFKFIAKTQRKIILQ